MEYPIYCEQTLYGEFFEPINTITNSFFVFASFLAFYNLRKNKNLEFRSVFLSIILLFIGIGSFVWHFYRSNLTVMMDSIPIMIFIFSYLFIYTFHITNRLWHRVILICGFFIYMPLFGLLLNKLFHYFQENRISMYLAPISYFIVLQLYTCYYKIPVIKKSLVVIFIFLVSLFFRQIDLILCESIGFGTHFIWHILNSVVLYKMIMLLYPKIKPGELPGIILPHRSSA